MKDILAGLLARFNPRSREGATMLGCGLRRDIRVSIHAPVRERRNRVFSEVREKLFQSTLP